MDSTRENTYRLEALSPRKSLRHFFSLPSTYLVERDDFAEKRTRTGSHGKNNPQRSQYDMLRRDGETGIMARTSNLSLRR